MKYRLLLIFAVVAAASPIAADTIESEGKPSLDNLTYNNSILLASSGGETVLSSTLSERGGVFVADRSNGRYTRLKPGHIQDVEYVNRTHIAYVSRNLTEDGIDSVFQVQNTETGEVTRATNISREVNDIEMSGPDYRFANSTGVYSVSNQAGPITALEIDEEAEVVDLEFSNSTTVIATSNPDQIVVREGNSSSKYNISQPEDLQIIGLRPLNVLVVHETRVVEYKASSGGLEEVWSYSGLEDGRAVNRLPDNTTVIADRDQVFAVSDSGDEVWETEFFSTSDIESGGNEAYSLEGSDSGIEVDSYWSPGERRAEEAQVGFLEGLFQAGFNSIFG